MAKREKKPVHKVVMTEGKRQIIQQLLQEYDIETAEDIHERVRDLAGGHPLGIHGDDLLIDVRNVFLPLL